MDLNTIGSFVNQCGFPIFISVVCIIAFYKIGKTLFDMWQTDVKPTLDSVKSTQIEFVKTLQSLDCRVTSIETDVDLIKTDVREIKNKIHIQ